MRIEHLACLIEIKRRKSLSTAAGHLGLTQQALSACIKSMENELGVPLLIRTRQGSTLTPEGEEVLEAAENIVSCYRRLRSSLSRQNEPELPSRLAGELRLYTNSPFYLPFNPEIIKKFCEQHPQLRLSITELPQDTIYEKLMSPLAEGTDQIGIINIPFGPGGELLREFLPPFPHLRFRPFVKGGYLACVSKLSPLARSKRLSLRTLLKYPVVMGASEEMPTTPLHYLLKQYGSPRFVLSAATLSLWSMAITNNSGIGFIHEALLRKKEPLPAYLQDLIFIRIREHLAATTGYILPPFPGEASLELLNCLPTPLDKQ